MSIIIRDMMLNYYSLEDSSRLDLDRAIDVLVSKGAFSDKDLIVLKLTLDGFTPRIVAEITHKTTSHINNRLKKIAKKLAGCLGIDYQDEKILREVACRLGRPLTSEEEVFCWKVIKAGQSLGQGLTIFNFEIGRYGKIIKRDASKTEG